MTDRHAFRKYLDQPIAQYPELFPAEIAQGCCFDGFRSSAKLGLVSRRIRLVSNGQAYQLRPDFVMPYMIGETKTVEKGLYLRRFGIPYVREAFPKGSDCLRDGERPDGLVSSLVGVRSSLSSRQQPQR